jgi:hypothetical protein
MGNRFFKRALALCLAMVLTVVSSLAVMAAEKSPSQGDVNPAAVIPNRTTFVVVKDKLIDVSYTNLNAVSYIVEYKTNYGTWETSKAIPTNDPQATITKLMRGGKYDIRIRGINVDGKEGKNSREAHRFLRSCTPLVTARKKGFNINVPRTNEGITGYMIYWTRDKSFNRKNIMTVSGATLNKTLYAVSGLTYYVRVVPISQDDNGNTYIGVMNGTHGVVIK